MDARAIHIVNIGASRRCAAIATDQLPVLARSQSVSQDAGFQRSRELAEEFCARVHDVASMSSITADRVALLAGGVGRTGRRAEDCGPRCCSRVLGLIASGDGLAFGRGRDDHRVENGDGGRPPPGLVHAGVAELWSR